MTASLLELVLTGALLVVIAGAVAAGVVGYLAWRAVRRRIRAVRSHGLFLGATEIGRAHV